MITFCHLALFLFVITVSDGLAAEDEPCEPGFKDYNYKFIVTRKILERGRILGKVNFEPCCPNTNPYFDPKDTRFQVLADGTVRVKRQVTLHDTISFLLNAWDGMRVKFSVLVSILNKPILKESEQEGSVRRTQAAIHDCDRIAG